MAGRPALQASDLSIEVALLLEVRGHPSCGSRSGLVLEDPVFLPESNSTVAWLRPHALVATVATGHPHRLGLG